MYKRLLSFLILTLIFFCFLPTLLITKAQEESTPTATFTEESTYIPPPVLFYRGKVVEISKPIEEEQFGSIQTYQITKVEILDEGESKDKIIEVKHNDAYAFDPTKKVKIGETVVLTKTSSPIGDTYYISDKYRLPALGWIFAIFLSLVIFFGRVKGFTSILGLGFSIFIIAQYIVPNIINGQNPFLTTLIGTLGIAFISIFISHGFSKRTSIALLSTVITLGLSILLSMLFVSMARLYGMGSEAAFYLQIGPLEKVNLQGLLLGGILIGTLGVLDDITTSLSAAIEELKKANQAFSFRDLYLKGTSIGREHIASLVNTLVLAYAGTSLPLFLLFTVNKGQPLWTTLNSEFFAEEIIRTLVGSSALVLAVPITTVLAAFFYSKKYWKY